MTRHQKRMLKQAAKQICLHILFTVICFVTLIPILYALSVSLNADNSLVSSDFRFIPKTSRCEIMLRSLPKNLSCCGLKTV